MNNKTKFPSKSTNDYIHSVVKSSPGAVPIAGSFLLEFFHNVIAKREEEWMTNVANKIEEISSQIKTFKIGDLKENEEFLDAVIMATKAAIATSSVEKQNNLLNALQNIALHKNQEKVKNTIFLNFIDRFTDAHIVICSILANPNDFRSPRREFDTKETYRELINKTILGIDAQVINVIVKELYDNGLITISSPDLDNFPPFMDEGCSRLTKFGNQFLIFITKPNL